MPKSDSPPPVLDRARVIAYAVLDDSVQWTGRQKLFVDGKALGPVPRLALCQNVEGNLKDILVFHCNDEWAVLGVSGGETLEAAKASAERAYRGVGARWIPTNVTEDEAKSWIEQNCADVSCSFCDRTPGDYQHLVGNKSGGVRICNHCIDEYYALIRKPAET
jgi:ClpX C4-type zinc finger protein